MKTVLSREIAEQELEKWFDFRKAKESERNNIDETTGEDHSREKLIEGFMYGELKFDDETGILTQILKWEITKESGESVLSELNFKPRIQRAALNEPLKGVKPTDIEGRTRAWISAVTGQNKGIIGKLDTKDFALSEVIVMYFLT